MMSEVLCTIYTSYVGMSLWFCLSLSTLIFRYCLLKHLDTSKSRLSYLWPRVPEEEDAMEYLSNVISLCFFVSFTPPSLHSFHAYVCVEFSEIVRVHEGEVRVRRRRREKIVFGYIT
ncbi:hypothetical protein G7K_3713-t1 [Saitoella complicata NRRL Y-17804]|uniref:Uncharacterized protein n=1 Tax=Saitoella complicata (strain BCRC 22490 / CBS 7301 / JCM 7358 / NBRC 10748 / NRRL Y-17804) TaxID=698492 RepID=A0A0E9NI90_SAICN|nr:hypothetical protein G7K_3713-t1 [Saitoella complicata NRRL Y-17804]